MREVIRSVEVFSKAGFRILMTSNRLAYQSTVSKISLFTVLKSRLVVNYIYSFRKSRNKFVYY